MCVRYSFSHSREKIEKRFNVKVNKNWKPRYNVAPLDIMPVITNKDSGELSFFKWGFVPNWALNDSSAANLINAKAETLLSKAPFKHAVKTQRCIIPADGFFEWKREGKNRIPYRITLNSDEAFVFAGLWDSWENHDGDIINTFTIITTEANDLMKEIHNRMPVILSKDLENTWLNESLTDSDIMNLLKPFDSNKMNAYKVNKIVDSTQYDIPECLQVAPKIYPGETYSLFD